MPFKFTELSIELALEIIRLAAVPRVGNDAFDSVSFTRPHYATAVSLASVSYAIRRATMPFLLRTVVLTLTDNHVAFIRSILLQRQLKKRGSRLALDYSTLIRSFWSTHCWAPVVDEPPEDRLDYSALYEIIRGVGSVGLNYSSLHLLYNGLSSPIARASEDWTCQRVTFAGTSCRWKPLTSTPEGLVFLRKITHLTLWISGHDSDSNDQEIIPSWVQQVPFALMPSLTHFACPLLRNQIQHEGAFHVPTEMIVYIATPSVSNSGPSTLPRWLSSPDPLAHGTVVPFNIPRLPKDRPMDLFWESAYLHGASDDAWAKAELASAKRE